MKQLFVILLFISIVFIFKIVKKIKIIKSTKRPNSFTGVIPDDCLLNYYFDEVICISSTKEKKAKMKKKFKKWGLKVKFYDSHDLYTNTGKKDKSTLVFKDTLSENYENSEEINKHIFNYLINLPNDWDVVNFYPKWELRHNNMSNKYFQVSSYLPKSDVFAVSKNVSDYLNKSILNTNELKIYSTQHIIF